MSDPVVELVETLKAVRLEVAAINQKIDTKAATPAQLAELTRAVKAANPAELASSISIAAVQAGQTIAAKVGEKTDALSDIVTALTTYETNLKNAVKGIGDTEKAIQRASFWLNIRTITVLAVAVFLGVGGSLASLAWQRHESASLRTEETALTAQIQTDKANLAALDAKGGKVKWNTCGGKLCFEAASNQGTQGPLPANWSGWETTDGRHIPLIIPRGY